MLQVLCDIYTSIPAPDVSEALPCSEAETYMFYKSDMHRKYISNYTVSCGYLVPEDPNSKKL